MNFRLIACVVMFLYSVLAFSLTDKQIAAAQTELKSLPAKNLSDYKYLESNLKNTSVYPYLKYKQISTAPEFFSQAELDQFFTKNNSTIECTKMKEYWPGSDIESSSCITNKAYKLALDNDFDSAISVLKELSNKNTEYLNYINAWREAVDNPSKLDAFIGKYHITNILSLNRVLKIFQMI